MKILFITGSLNQGGAEYQILELAKLFKNNGHEVEVFAITDYDFYKPFIKKNQLEYNHLLNSQSKIKRVFLTAKKIRAFKPGLVISYLRSVSQVALFAKILSRLRVKLIVGERTSLILPTYDRYYFNIMRFANFISVNSFSKLEYLNKNFPKLNNKVGFLPNIIDLEKFTFLSKRYDATTLKIGFIGRISPEKNVYNLVKAIKILLDRNVNLELDIYGDTRNEEYLRKVENLISESNLNEKISLRGKSNDIKAVYKSIDILCLISDYEGFSNVLSEALSCGVPIITSNIKENIFLVEDEVNGFVINHKEPISIADGINNYYNLSESLKKTMAINNRKKAEEIFHKQNIYNNYLEIINSL